MSKIYFGYTTKAHGLKGELKCFSDFERKDLVFQKDHPIYIEGEKHIITHVRPHKKCYLIEIDHLKDINEVEDFRHQKIWIERDELSLKDGEFLYQDLIGLVVKENGKSIGKVSDIRYNKSGILLAITGEKKFLIPYVPFYIQKIDWQAKTIAGQNLKGLIA